MRQPHEENRVEEPRPTADEAAERYRRDRRRLLGVAASGSVLAVVHSRAAFAQTQQVSGNFSGGCSFGGTNTDCAGGGLTPGFWRQYHHRHLWHREFPPEADFDRMFGVEVYRNATLFEVVNDNHGDLIQDSYLDYLGRRGDEHRKKVGQLNFHAVAALQNAASIIPYPMNVAEVLSQVGSVLASGHVESMIGLKDELDFLNNQNNDFWSDLLKNTV